MTATRAGTTVDTDAATSIMAPVASQPQVHRVVSSETNAADIAQVSPIRAVRHTAAPPHKREEMRRKTLRLDADIDEQAVYWADRHDMTFNDYAAQALVEKIARDNGVHVMPGTLVDHRINQLVDAFKGVEREVANNSMILTNGFDSIIGLTRGDSYLTDDLSG